MKRILLAIWVVTWTQTDVKIKNVNPRGDEWVCFDVQKKQLFDDEMKAWAEASALQTDGLRNVQVWKAEPVKPDVQKRGE